MSQDFVFLLGAGASKSAGLPLLGEISTIVRQRLPPVFQDLYNKIEQAIPKAGVEQGKSVEDILYLLDTALIAQSAIQKGVTLYDIGILEPKVRKIIWEELSKEPELAYLEPFLNWIEKDQGLQIFTLNNDLVIEKFCGKHGLPLFRGFSAEGFWKPELFDRVTGVRLYKLHGSVDWSYKPGLPIKQHEGFIVRKPDGTKVFRSPLPEMALVFPSQNKVVTSVPLLNLFMQFHQVLIRAKVLIVVGYRLADVHVLGFLLDALRANRDLRVLIVNRSAFEIMDRIAPRKSGDIKSRIDCLPMYFDEALKGPMREIANDLAKQKFSIGIRLRRALREIPEENALREVEIVAPLIPGATATDECILSAVLNEFSPAPSIESPRLAIYEDLHRIHKTENWKQEIGSQLMSLRSNCNKRFWFSCIGIASANRDLFVIGGHKQRVCKLNRDWSYTSLGPALHDAYGLAVLDGYAFVAERRIAPENLMFGVEGFGRLRRIDLQSGKASTLLLFKEASVPMIKNIFRSLRSLTSQSEESRAKLKRELLRMGFLNYPTAVRSFSKDRILVVEANRISIVNIRTMKVDQRSNPEFENLADACVLDEKYVLLCEGGMRGQGRIVIWSVSTNESKVLTANLTSMGGIAVDFERNYLLVTLGMEFPEGKVIKISITRDLQPSGDFEIVIKRLHVPRYLCQVEKNTWYCSSVHGPVRFTLG